MKQYIYFLSVLLIFAININAQDYYRLKYSDVVIDGDSIVSFNWRIAPGVDSIYCNETPYIIVPSEYTDTVNNVTYIIKKIGSEAFIYSDVIFRDKKKKEKIKWKRGGFYGVKIEEGIVSVGEKAFARNALRELILPQTLKYIDSFAFGLPHYDGCVYDENSEIIEENTTILGIEELNIPANVEYIGTCAFGISATDFFHSLNTIKKIIFHEGLKKIGRSAFAGNCEVKRLEFPNSLQYIDEYAFYKTKIDTLILSDVTYIGNYAFWTTGCNVLVPNTIVHVGQNAFYGAKKVVFEEGVTHIDENAFPCVDSVKFSSTIEVIERGAFRESFMNVVDLRGTNLKYIAPNAFYNGYKTLYIEGDSLVLDERAFYVPDINYVKGDNNKTSIYVGKGVVDIRKECFSSGNNVNYSIVDLSKAVDLMHVGVDAFKSIGAPSYIELPIKDRNDEDKNWYAYSNSVDEIDFEHTKPIGRIDNMFQGIDEHVKGYVAQVVARNIDTNVEQTIPSIIANVRGRTVTLHQLCEVKVYDLSGLLVYQGYTDRIVLNHQGVYIIDVCNENYKICIY